MQVPKQNVYYFVSNALEGVHQYTVLQAFLINVHWEDSPSKQHAFLVLSSFWTMHWEDDPSIC